MKHENNILKWFNNELSKQEVSDLKNSEDVQTLEKVLHYSSFLQAPKVDAEKALLAFKESHAVKKEVKVRTLNFKVMYRVAAVAVIMLSASYFMFFNNNVSFETEIAQTKTLALPDNSEVILNAASLLDYNKKSWDKKRDLNLDGEAFFKVSKGQKFTVNTDIGTVEVLGTQFNVKERNNYFEVQCYEGLVGVTYQGQTVKLTKGKTFRIVNGVIIDVDEFNTLTPSWLQSESSFVEVPLAQVIEELERQYNIEIIIKDIDTTQLFTGTFTHTDKKYRITICNNPIEVEL